MPISLMILYFVAVPHWIINLAWTFVVEDAEEKESKYWKVSMWCAWSEFFVVWVFVVLEQNKWLLVN